MLNAFFRDKLGLKFFMKLEIPVNLPICYGVTFMSCNGFARGYMLWIEHQDI